MLPGMVEVMTLGRWKEGQVIAAVVDGGADNYQGIPYPGHSQMGPSYDWPQHYWGEIDHIVLQWVAVDGGNSNGSCPLVVGLMDVLVETGVVE